MSTIQIMVNKADPNCDELATALEEHLRELNDVITYKRMEREADPDELFGLVEIVGYAIAGTAILTLVKTAIDIVKGILEIREITRKGETPPLVVVVDGRRLALPATEADESAFLAEVRKLEVQ